MDGPKNRGTADGHEALIHMHALCSYVEADFGAGNLDITAPFPG